MKDKPFLLLFLIATFQLACAPEQKIEAYNITPFLEAKVKLAKSSGQKVKLELCKTTSFKWDKIIVILPYTGAQKIRDYELDNSKFIENNMIDSLYDENRCLLLYIEKNAIAHYSFVPTTPLNFYLIHDNLTPEILTRRFVCDELYIKLDKSQAKLWH